MNVIGKKLIHLDSIDKDIRTFEHDIKKMKEKGMYEVLNFDKLQQRQPGFS